MDSNGTAPKLTERHAQDLRASGLSDEQIALCGFYSVRDIRQIAKILNWSRAAVPLGECLAIPFHDLSGARLDYTRLKPDSPRYDKRGKKVKYESPRQVGNRAYFPPLRRADFLDASVPIIITEGEKKAAKADQEGFCCVGLVGVYGWQVGRDKDAQGQGIGQRDLIDDLRQLPWSGRSVWIAYDSDAAEKPEVAWAEWHLAEALIAKGASVRVARLPKRPGESNGRSKVGLDDLLVEFGIDALHRVLADARMPEKPSTCDGPEEAIDDPNRLARMFLEQRCAHADGPTLRYYREQWWRWDGEKYRNVPDPELDADLCAFAVDEFVRANLEELRGWEKRSFDERGAKPTVRKVTTGLMGNVRLALTPATIVPAEVQLPAWIGGESAAGRHCVAMRNGILDVTELFASGKRDMAPHSPRWFSTTCLPYAFEWGAECPFWDAFLRRNLEGDIQRVEVLQEWFGLSIVHDTSMQKFLLMSGEGGDGKSVVCAVLEAVLGADNCAHVPLEHFGERFHLNSTIGKLANIVSEVGELDRVAEGFLKSFTAGDAMQFDRKHKDPVEAVPTARLVLSTNNLPRFSDRSAGVWRRMIAMPFRVQMADDDPGRVRGMTRGEWWRDRGELPGIFFWALLGLKRLREQGQFTRSDLCEQFLSDYRVENNPARLFLTETCAFASEGRVQCGELYDSYRQWCRNNGYSALADRTFGREVKRAFQEVDRRKMGGESSRCYFYCGIELLESFHKI